MRCRIGATEQGRSRIAIGLVTILAGLGFQGSALAATSHGVRCAYDQFKQAATITVGAGSTATIVRSMSGSIDVNNHPCGAARIDNTVQISVLESTKGNQVVKVNLAGGPFFNPVADTRIRFTVNLKFFWDKLVVLGTNGADNITYGERGINLARSERHPPVDVSFENLERVVVVARAGKDRVTANGGNGTAAPSNLLPGRTTFFGGRDADVLIGSNRSFSRSREGAGFQCSPTPPCKGTATGEDLYGDRNHDEIHGLGGDDNLYGKGGKDDLFGDSGDDFLDGGAKHDTCTGGPGSDTFDPSCEVNQNLSIARHRGARAQDHAIHSL
jgi:Ca2+-binding RTX toxin-like protein